MSWSRQTSLQRIRSFRATAPAATINLRNFDQGFVVARHAANQTKMKHGGKSEPLIFDVPPDAAILLDGVHVYIQMLDFGDAMIERERETEASHRRVLSMLHLNYTACDQVAEEFEAQRVDFHGSRMHAVIISPPGAENAKERAARALAFADAAKRAIEEVGRTTENGRYSTRIRVGVDSGSAVAVNSGSKDEREPLFLGAPANYAAKLAEGDEDGIFMSNQVRRDLGVQEIVSHDILYSERHTAAPTVGTGFATNLSYLAKRLSDADITKAAMSAKSRFVLDVGTDASFSFHRHTPPLKSIDFSLLMPSNSIRMGLVSIFGDVDGFTKYVDECIAQGRIGEMVSNLHVIRSELAATLSDDFDGRKVRFIGDCVHGLLAAGTAFETDASASVVAAVKAAGGIRSSFELCKQELDGIGGLGIAIGLEFGETPITRIGIRGDRSVRCSVSRAVSKSEELQRDCTGEQTALGPTALGHAPIGVRSLFEDGVAWNLDASSVVEHLSAPPTVKSGDVSATAAPYSSGER
ncbi:adenylate/guanylate cyclase domain-containing protein [Rhizobium leguminosarum]|uniref:adenylate/guanylate cyclase domain-containing protein n=1 Tax=Rhizobium leguminosarum TaxID=384 RepID=UPI001C96F03F|nr:adenylate/guanylate cyclase domain-containing protein [Rhizobium leguminosarum]MBY5587704.1 adenylate/guanylate cyclase domain-containing protein [Rhizobium leguminosarum]